MRAARPAPEPPWTRRDPGRRLGVLAHRGGTGPYPENSLDAFAEGLRQGADGVELDVRRTADGVLVVHHDAALADGRAIGELPADQLPWHIPTLAQALAACAGAGVDVEIKNSPLEPGHDPDEAVAAATAELAAGCVGATGGPAWVVISSFWPTTVAAVRAARPELAAGLLVHPALDVRNALEQAEDLGATTLLPFRSQVDRALVDEAHQRGLAVVAWTVNEEADLRDMLVAGADAVVTDQVARAVSVLGRP